jgi:hypothetical protein
MLDLSIQLETEVPLPSRTVFSEKFSMRWRRLTSPGREHGLSSSFSSSLPCPISAKSSSQSHHNHSSELSSSRIFPLCCSGAVRPQWVSPTKRPTAMDDETKTTFSPLTHHYHHHHHHHSNGMSPTPRWDKLQKLENFIEKLLELLMMLLEMGRMLRLVSQVPLVWFR